MPSELAAMFPEHLLAKGTYKGLDWEVGCNRLGYRCGYVLVPPGHAWFRQDYDNISAEVHGGLTYSRPGVDKSAVGWDESTTEWWVGFDCAHMGDAPDPELPGYKRYPWDSGKIRTTTYVQAECEKLIDQALEAGPSSDVVYFNFAPDG